MKTIKQVYKIEAPVQKVWQALTDPAIIEKWGGGPAKMDDCEGTEFSLWGGDIHGKNLDVTENKKLVQEWFGGHWDKPSKVTFTLTEKETKTEVRLNHSDVPDREAKDIADGWKIYYFGPLKNLLEK